VKNTIRQRIISRNNNIRKRLKRASKKANEKPVMAGSNIRYELADRTGAITHGGIGLIHRVVKQVGLERRINEALRILKQHNPYFESDHVLNIAYNCLCGGQSMQDIELRRNDEVFLDALGAESIPDPTTAGDFCRRFEEEEIRALMDAINEARLEVWKSQPAEFLRQTAIIDADGTLVPTCGECKEGMDIGHKGIWGYDALLMSLANTQEELYIGNRSASRPSHEGAPALFDKSIELCRRGGFKDIMLRGDTDFALTAHFDRWDGDGVSFIFGFDATNTMHEYAWTRPESEYQELVRRAEREIKTKPRARPENVKEKIVKEREFKNIRLESEQVAEFDYSPYRCKKTYRVVAVRKNLSVEKGENVLFDEVRFFFYITNVKNKRMKKADVVRMANQRCNQENLIEQLKNGVRALHAPVNTLNANWAYMVMASLAWNLKAWSALMLPATGRWHEKHERERSQILRMDFRTYLNTFITIPAQIIRTGRRIVYRILSTNPWQHILFRLAGALRC
jgi:hypothetical protein